LQQVVFCVEFEAAIRDAWRGSCLFGEEFTLHGIGGGFYRTKNTDKNKNTFQ